MKTLIIVSNMDTKQYFISPDHNSFGLEHFVPVTHYLEYGEESVRVKEDVIALHYNDYEDITDSKMVQDAISPIKTVEDLVTYVKEHEVGYVYTNKLVCVVKNWQMKYELFASLWSESILGHTISFHSDHIFVQTK
jgi:hypothetical protein